MLIVLLSWFILLFVFISFGDILLVVYNKLCKRNEEYSLINLFLLGIPSLLTILSIIHFVSPVNGYILLLLFLLSILHWLFHKETLFQFWETIKKIIHQFSTIELCIIFLFTFSILFITAWGILNYDPGCYHYQSLKWIEEYSTVVGLGNIEERLGFNSNYFILSAPFSMRFVLAEPLFALQGLLVVLMFIWIASEVVKSNYSFKCVSLLLLHILIIAINILHFADSSTDVLPNQIVFYLVAYLVLHQEQLKKSYLLFTVLPVTLLTFKLSLAVFALLALLVSIEIINKKEYKAFAFIIVSCFVICVLWLIRNVILSGYLVFPMHELDFFPFDWKVPKEVAILERTFIHVGAIWQFKNLYNNALTLFYAPEWSFFHTYFIATTYVTLILSSFYIFYLKLKSKVVFDIFVLYLIVIAGILTSYISAPDFRFSYGLVFGGLFIGVAMLSDTVFEEYFVASKIKYSIATVLVVLLLFHLNVTFFDLSTTSNTGVKVVYKPRSYEDKKGVNSDITHNLVKINNNIELYVSKNYSGFTMYKLPAVPDDMNNRLGWRFQHYNNLVARGTSLQDGFRTR